MEIIIFLFYLCFGSAMLVIALHTVAVILVLLFPLSREREAALIWQMRKDERDWREREGPMRAQMLEQLMSKEATASLYNFELNRHFAEQGNSAEVVPFPAGNSRRSVSRP